MDERLVAVGELQLLAERCVEFDRRKTWRRVWRRVGRVRNEEGLKRSSA